MVYSVGMTDDTQAWLAAAIKAEAAARNLSIRQLAIKAGIADKVLRRALDGQRPMWVPQLTRIAMALDMSVSALVLEAERRATFATPVTPLGRKDIEGFLASPGSDPTLNTQLSEAREVSGVSGFELTQLLERIERLRRDELLQLLGDLDRANRNHGAS